MFICSDIIFHETKEIYVHLCTINSKINGTPKGVYLPNFKLHSILAVVNFLAHNNKCYYGQVNSLRLKSSVASKLAINVTHWGYHLFFC